MGGFLECSSNKSFIFLDIGISSEPLVMPAMTCS